METVIKTPELIRRLRDHLKACDQASSMDWHRNYGRSLAYLRDKKGMTLRTLAESSGISHAKLWRLENGETRWTEEFAVRYLEALE